MSAENPVETINLNVRAMLAIMRNAGLEVESFKEEGKGVGAGEGKKLRKKRSREADVEESDDVEDDDVVDEILTERCKETRWVKVDIY